MTDAADRPPSPPVTGGWSFADALLLVAMGSGRRGATLSAVLSSMDAHDRSYVSGEQFERSLGRLVASGLATTSDGRLAPTDRARVLWRRVSWRTGMTGVGGEVRAALAGVPVVDGPSPVTAAVYQAALAERSTDDERRREQQAYHEATRRTPPEASRSVWWPGGWAIADDLLVAAGIGILPAVGGIDPAGVAVIAVAAAVVVLALDVVPAGLAARRAGVARPVRPLTRSGLRARWLVAVGFLVAGLLPAAPFDHRVRLAVGVVVLVSAVLATARWGLVRRRPDPGV